MFTFVTSNFYLMNVLFGLSIGLIAKIAFSPVKPTAGSILSDIWIWLGLGVLGSVLASFIGSLFGWTNPQATTFSIANMLTALAGALVVVFFYQKLYLRK